MAKGYSLYPFGILGLILLVTGCGGGSSFTTVASSADSHPTGSTQSGVVTLSQTLDPRYAGELRFDLAQVRGSLPDSFTLQGATFLLFEEGQSPFYAAAMGSLFKPLDPFQHLSLPGIEAATLTVTVLPLDRHDSPGHDSLGHDSLGHDSLGHDSSSFAPIFQSNPRLVTLRDVGMVLALQQLGGGSPTGAQFSSQYFAITGAAVPANSINPLPNLTNSDFASPVASITLADVAVVQAAFMRYTADRTPVVLASMSTRLLQGTTRLDPDDILMIPGIGSLPTPGSGIVLSPPVAGGDRAGNIAFSVKGTVVAQQFTLGSATFTQDPFPHEGGFTRFVAAQGSEFALLSTFNSLTIPGLSNRACVIVHPINARPENLSTQFSRSQGCGDPRAPQLDVLAVNLLADTVSVFSGNGNGSFQAQTTYGVATRPSSGTLGDLNGDGHLDLVTTSREQDYIHILLGKGDDTFHLPNIYSVGDFPLSVTSGDVNGDGILDIVTVNHRSNNVSVLVGNGNGTFQTQTTYAVGTYAYAATLGDVNQDGFLDLAVANGENSLSILIGNGNGTFQPQARYSAGTSPYFVMLGDVNRDSDLDLVGVNEFSQTVSVLLNQGNGTFAPQVTYGVGSSPFAGAMGDFNTDGYLDIVTGSDDSVNLALLLGNGDGTFQPQVVVDAGGSPYSVKVGDINRDGNLDIASASRSQSNVSIVLGNGNGTFQSPITYAAGNSPHTVLLGEL